MTINCQACFKRPAWIGASIHGEHFCTHCLITLAIEVDYGTGNPIAVTKALAVSIGATSSEYDPYVTLDKDSIVSAFVARDDNGEVKHVSIAVIPKPNSEDEDEKE